MQFFSLSNSRTLVNLSLLHGYGHEKHVAAGDVRAHVKAELQLWGHVSSFYRAPYRMYNMRKRTMVTHGNPVTTSTANFDGCILASNLVSIDTLEDSLVKGNMTAISSCFCTYSSKSRI